MKTHYTDELKRGTPKDDAIIEECIQRWGPKGPQMFILYLELFNRRRTTFAMEHGFFGTYYSEVQNRELYQEIVPKIRRDYLAEAFKLGKNLYETGQTVDALARMLDMKLFGADRPQWVKGK